MENKIPNCWQICNCKNKKKCCIPKMGMGHSCWVICNCMCCDHCEVYELYNRETGKMGSAVAEHFPKEEEKYQKALKEKKIKA
ncbi:MAG: hypothetical protein GY756_03165 [bacterium]|nr:hypothetical protein [bacterium]